MTRVGLTAAAGCRLGILVRCRRLPRNPCAVGGPGVSMETPHHWAQPFQGGRLSSSSSALQPDIRQAANPGIAALSPGAMPTS